MDPPPRNEGTLNQEPDKDFDLVLAPYGEILQKTRTDHIIEDERDKDWNIKKVFGPKKISHSLKMSVGDNMDNPIPRDFKY